MAWCIWVFLVLTILGSFWNFAKMCQKDKTNADLFGSAVAQIVSLGGCLALLYFGGAFHAIGLN